MIRFLMMMMICIVLLQTTRAQAVDFGREIQPILSDACYHCHGPDETGRKGKLRLDTRDGAFRMKEGKSIIIPGKSDQSEIIKRITTHDPDDHMPPPDSNRKLTAKQIELLKKWVDEGAKWGTHWAFESPKLQPIPKTAQAAWPRNFIDHFVLAKMEKEGFTPSPPASREALIRRVTFDLTGLPPTPAQVDAFLKDQSPDAYEHIIDRLLASTAYGERMATDWLDLARYADTHGFQMDRYRSTWPWRDWVIKSFNQNLPFDQFVLWQVAGDLLPDATKDQRLATAFNRHHMQNEEGGIVEEEYRVGYVVDRVTTFGTAFLGLTLECCRCHDHKYDPVSQKDFYALFAFFQNIDESGQTTYFTDSVPVPTLLMSSDAQDAKLIELRKAIAEKESQIAERRDVSAPEFKKWLIEKGEMPAPAGLVGAWSFDDLKTNKIANSVATGKPARSTDSPKPIEGKQNGGAELSGENGFDFPEVGHFSRVDPFTISLWLQAPVMSERAVVLHHSKAPIDAGSRGYELLIENGKVAFGLHHMWPGNSIKVISKNPIKQADWTHVTITYDGSSRASGVSIYFDGALIEQTTIKDNLTKDITYGGGEPNLTIGHRFRDNGFKGGKLDEFKVFNRDLTPLEVANLVSPNDIWNKQPANLSAAQTDILCDYYHRNTDDITLALRVDLQKLRDQENKTINTISEMMVMKELPAPKPANVLKRGSYDAPGEKVFAQVPGVLPPMQAGLPRNRLGLAKWLLDPNHPLMARVTVNRFWQQMFGEGLVHTSDNFGLQGTPPTHPELLDQLSRAFVDDMKWDVKKLLKTIALSATYQQSSRLAPAMLARDPDNQFLARAPARRLSAEMLRDQALSISGLLVDKIGGPSVKPYQPAGLWEEIAMGRPTYGQGKGDDLHRRSLYTFWKRTVPPPAMVTLDAAQRSVCTVKRQNTSTPLQALVLLNDVQMVEAARQIAARIIKEGGAAIDDRLAWGFKLVIGRAATTNERAILKTLHDEQRARLAQQPADANRLLAAGEAKHDAKLDTLDLAAMTVVAQALMNHDGCLMRR